MRTVEVGLVHDHGKSLDPQTALRIVRATLKNPEQSTFFNPNLGDRKIAESVCTGKENPMFSRLPAGFTAAWSLQVTVS
jgi:hypothetical protein